VVNLLSACFFAPTLIPTDTFAAAEFLVRHMYRPVELGNGASHFAIAETALPIAGDSWFWTDDNAKVLEFLSRPELWQRFPRQTTEIFRFVRAMCHGPLIFRRVSPLRLEPTDKQETLSGYCHSLMDVKYDLSRGEVIAGLRFHDERNRDNLLMTGNYVEFTHHRHRFKLKVEPAISDIDARQRGHTLKLCHYGDLHFESRRKQLRLGRIGYTYTIDARSMSIEVEVNLEIEPGVAVTDVVLTIGHDQLGRMRYRTIATNISPAQRPLYRAGIPGRRLLNAAGASYYLIRQPNISGDCFAIHSVPRDPARLTEIETAVQRWGRLRSAVARYSFPGSQSGARLVVGEHKLLTGGGFYDRIADYAALMRGEASIPSTQQAARDLSTSYDYGSKINAFAKCFAVCKTGEVAIDAASLDELRSLFDLYLNYYHELFVDIHEKQRNSIFSRDLAFVILGVVTMYRATNGADYLRRLRRLCEVLLEFEVRSYDTGGDSASGFLMRMTSPRVAYVDCHSAALLALTQAACHLDDPRLVAAIERGLASYCVETCTVAAGGPDEIDTVSTSLVDRLGTRRTENAFWNFKAGMTLRFFAALGRSPHPSLRSIVARYSDRMVLFESVLRGQLERSITQNEGEIEIRTAVSAGETNSETQPWVMLGLFGHPCD
jgi:hypothetical protein